MLLSQANLLILSHKKRDLLPSDVEKSKLERIQSFIDNQKMHAVQYKSPNLHYSKSNSEGEKNSMSVHSLHNDENDNDDDDGTGLFSSSISQVMSRKYDTGQEVKIHINTSLPKQVDSKISIPSRYKRRHSLLPHQDRCKTKQKKIMHNSSKKNDPKPATNSPLLPQTNAHGFNLLQKFVSPNLEINRITTRPKNYHQRPTLGLFNKGRSSAKATKPVPDLVFSETKFLKPNQGKTITSCNSSSRHSSILQPSISKFFKAKSPEQQPPKTQTVSVKTSKSLGNMRLDGSAVRNNSIKNNQSVKARNSPCISIVSSLHSNQSIERLLRECKNAPQVSLDYHQSNYTHDNYSHHNKSYEQLPTYARVRTPVSNRNDILKECQQSPILNESYNEIIESSYLELMEYGVKHSIDSKTPTPSEATLLTFYKNRFYYDDSHESIQEQHQHHERNQSEDQYSIHKPFDHGGLLDWQIESIASFDDAESVNLNSHDVANFWQNQFKRAL